MQIYFVEFCDLTFLILSEPYEQGELLWRI